MSTVLPTIVVFWRLTLREVNKPANYKSGKRSTSASGGATFAKAMTETRPQKTKPNGVVSI